MQIQSCIINGVFHIAHMLFLFTHSHDNLDSEVKGH